MWMSTWRLTLDLPAAEPFATLQVLLAMRTKAFEFVHSVEYRFMSRLTVRG
jgi:hypothetical protein